MTRGINCIIWNSDFARVDKRIPKASATRASTTLTIITFKILPTTSTSSSQIAAKTTTAV